MKNKLRFIAFIIAIITTFSSALTTTNAEAIDYKRYKGFVYYENYEDDGNGNEVVLVTITNYKGKKTNITIPEIIDGKPVERVESLKKAKNLKSVHFHSGISYIGPRIPVLNRFTVGKDNPKYYVKGRFLMANSEYGTYLIKSPINVKSVTIPKSVDYIGDCAFLNTKVSKVKLHKNLESINGEAFSNCQNLTKIRLNKNLKSVEGYAFKNCKNLKKVVFNSKLEEIGGEAFKGCSSLKSVKLPETLKWIGDRAFEKCKKLENIYIYSKKCKIEYDAEYGDCAIPSNITIHGYKGSSAEKYAKKNGNEFVPIV